MSEARERVFSRLSGLEAGSDQTGNGGAERTPAAGPRVWAFAMCLVALLLAFGANWVVPNCARAEEDEVQKARVVHSRRLTGLQRYTAPTRLVLTARFGKTSSAPRARGNIRSSAPGGS